MALKICPNCKNKLGPRAGKCTCGHIFTPNAKVEVKHTAPVESPSLPTQAINVSASSKLFGVVTTPTGKCPVKPYGFKPNWPDGPASEDVIKSWAIGVVNYGNEHGKCYATSAVIYFAREFWDLLNFQEFDKIKATITTCLNPPKPEVKEDEC